MINIYPTIFLILSICTLSLSVIRIAEYPVTFAFFFVLVYVAKTIGKIKLTDLFAFSILNAFLIFNALVNIGRLDVIEFIKSYLLTVFFLYCYTTSFSILSKQIGGICYHSLIFYSTTLIVGFEALQIIDQIYFDSTSLWFLFDGISISTADDIGRFEAVNYLGFFRPISFYHEPSYLAAVLFVLFVANDQQLKNKTVRYTLIVSIFFTLSITLLVFLIIYLLIELFDRQKKYFLILLPIVFLMLIYMFLNFTFFFRFDEINTEGTSGWIRLILPMSETNKIINQSIFGIPLGQSKFIFDNSLFLIISTFGILTPILLSTLIIYIKNKLRSNILTLKYLTVFFSILFLNGAIFTIEAAVLCLLINLSFLDKREKK